MARWTDLFWAASGRFAVPWRPRCGCASGRPSRRISANAVGFTSGRRSSLARGYRRRQPHPGRFRRGRRLRSCQCAPSHQSEPLFDVAFAGACARHRRRHHGVRSRRQPGGRARPEGLSGTLHSRRDLPGAAGRDVGGAHPFSRRHSVFGEQGAAARDVSQPVLPRGRRAGMGYPEGLRRDQHAGQPMPRSENRWPQRSATSRWS